MRGAQAKALGKANPDVLASSATMACSGSDAATALARLIAVNGPGSRPRRSVGQDRRSSRRKVISQQLQGGLDVLVAIGQDGNRAARRHQITGRPG